ncbi:podocalyxin isoform X2 [Sardina pilchardus]|uniref:podocalyxin isoform X2 n=1 Tax=Sardina pilchardus TaxID=27697 RepID=UPI002E0E0843
MRVTWAILTLGLLWTTHVQSEDTDVTTKATTAVITTTAKVATAPPTTTAASPSAITTAAVTNATTTAMSAPAATSPTSKVAVTAAATAAPAAAAAATTTVAVVPTTVPAPPGSNTSKDSADKTTGTVTTISPTSKTIPLPKDVPTTSPNSGSTPSVSGSPTVSGDKATALAPHDANSSTSDPGSLSSSSNTSSSPSPSVSMGVTSGSVPTSTQPSTTTTAATTEKITTVPTTTTTTLPTTTPTPSPFSYFFRKTDNSQGDSTLGKLCSKLLEIITDGNCSLSGKKKHNGDYQFEKVIVHGDVNISVVESHYNKEVDEKKPDETKESSEESDYTTLIAILASCGAVALIIVCLAIYTYRHATPDGGAADGGERLPRQPHAGGDGGTARDSHGEEAQRRVQRQLDRPH